MPGLVKNRIHLRENAIHAKKKRLDEESKRKNRPTRVVEKETREQGLQKSLTSENKGFAMLSRMGYKSGQSIGKNSTTGIVEPIGIKIKDGRAGLGREAAIKELCQQTAEIRRARKSQTIETLNVDDYRKRMVEKSSNRKEIGDLGKCQRACEKLDQAEKIKEPVLCWFWPDRRTKEEIEEEQEQQLADDEKPEEDYTNCQKLEMLIKFLRTTYNYCHWCGVKFTDVTDLMENCAGPGKDDH